MNVMRVLLGVSLLMVVGEMTRDDLKSVRIRVSMFAVRHMYTFAPHKDQHLDDRIENMHASKTGEVRAYRISKEAE